MTLPTPIQRIIMRTLDVLPEQSLLILILTLAVAVLIAGLSRVM